VADTLSATRRSQNMRQIRSKNTRPEIVVRGLVHKMGYRYRLHVATLPGSPDLVFRRLNKIIEVKGCFWHRHSGCQDSHIPKSRRAYWIPKLRGNVRRDKKNLRMLGGLGWKVLIVWECEVNARNLHKLAKRLRQFLGAN